MKSTLKTTIPVLFEPVPSNSSSLREPFYIYVRGLLMDGVKCKQRKSNTKTNNQTC